jgi:DNA gyrase inhibitor GyrI
VVRITLEVQDGLDVGLSLKKLARWYDMNSLDPKNVPMKGVCLYKDDTILSRRDYRKTDCFVIHQDKATRPQGEK